MKEDGQRDRRISVKPIVLIVMLAVGIGVIIMLQSTDSPFDPIGDPLPWLNLPAPDFTLPNLAGNNVSLTDFRGKVVLLNIWATWCPPCVAEMPSMQKLYQELKDEGFLILAVSLDETGVEAVKPFIDKHRLDFPVLLDVKGEIKNLYQITGIPESFIIDRSGTIVEKVVGPRDWAASGAFRYIRNLLQTN